MKRREFIALAGGAAAWPLVGRAQQPPMADIGFLSSRSPREAAPVVAAFRKGLARTGYAEGQNVTIEYRWADGLYDKLPSLAADLARRQLAVIVATGGEPSAFAAEAATSTIPIVFTSGGDPVKLGLVNSLNRPDGNATGVSLFFAAFGPKRLELLQELLPKVAVIAVLVNPNYAATEQETSDVLAAGRTLGKQIDVVTASTEADFDKAFASMVARRADALVVGTDPFLISRRRELIALAARHALPTIYFSRDFVADGGLISYGCNLADGYHKVGVYAGRILNGARPSDLPVLQPTIFELVINLETARRLQLVVPASLLARADEVIE
jgi:putative ABC transport system substrate-binding protein